jgi:hypothetical protein
MRTFIKWVLWYHLISAIIGIAATTNIEGFKQSITVGMMMFQFLIDAGFAAFAVIMLGRKTNE